MVRWISFVVAIAAGLVAAFELVGLYHSDPVVWNPPSAPPLEGVYTRNTRLAAMETLLQDAGTGPEDIARDSQGRIYTGLDDGRILRAETDGSDIQVFANTGGRPLGMEFNPAGDLIVADAFKGLLSVSIDGRITVLATDEGGMPFRFTNDVAVDSIGAIYFSDSSSKYGPNQFKRAILEHEANGRLLVYYPATKTVHRLLGGLFFANGVALSSDQRFVLVNETGAYRVTRYWLDGPRAGSADIFIDNLPGFPDGISSNGKGTFWIALFAPRDDIVDALMPWPVVRRLVARLPDYLLPETKRYGFVLGLDYGGNVVQNLQDPAGAFAPITSVQQFGDALYFGSLYMPAIGHILAPRAMPAIH